MRLIVCVLLCLVQKVNLEASLMKILHQTEKLIHFNQCDPAGVMYFAQSFTLAHQLIEDFILASGIGWSSWFADPILIYPLIHAACDYRLPLQAGTECTLTLSITRLSLSSVVFITQAYADKGQNKPSFEVKTVHVAVSKITKKKDVFPKTIYDKLKHYKNRETHA